MSLLAGQAMLVSSDDEVATGDEGLSSSEIKDDISTMIPVRKKRPIARTISQKPGSSSDMLMHPLVTFYVAYVTR
jgi:hypothetical protein